MTLIGHACWLVETADARILFDPLLNDPNQCGCYEVHPARQIRIEALGDVDIIVVSHRHIDHFDIQSLCSLPRTAEVVCPRDPLITDALASIGFDRVSTIEEWSQLSRGATALVATPSTNPVPEYGFVVSDGARTIWNQVDTQLANDTAERVNRQFGRLDVVVAPWQPLLELKFQLYESIAFPHDEYADLIRRTSRCETQMLVPGACGFRYVEESGWLNRLAFPVARRRFVDDILSAMTGADTAVVEADPGDEIACEASGPVLRAEASGIVGSRRDEERIVAFYPVDPFRELLRDDSGTRVAGQVLAAVIDDLDEFVQRERSALAAYERLRVVYQLIVCGEHGNVFVSWDFGRHGHRADEPTMRATATCIIDEQSLLGLASGTVSWEQAFHSGGWRFFQTVADVSASGYSRPADGEIVDLLQLRYPYEPAIARHIEAEVMRYR